MHNQKDQKMISKSYLHSIRNSLKRKTKKFQIRQNNMKNQYQKIQKKKIRLNHMEIVYKKANLNMI